MMPSKIDQFIDYMRENPEKALTVDEIVARWKVTHVTAYSWARSPYVKEQRVGAKPKRIIFNPNKWNADHNGERRPSVDSQYKSATNDLIREGRAAHTNCIKFETPSEERSAAFLKALLEKDMKLLIANRIRDIQENPEESREKIKQIKTTLLTVYRTLEYIERQQNGN